MQYEHNKRKYIRVQRLINLLIAKAFRTSNEALCILTGITPIIIKTEEAVKMYNARKAKENNTQEIDNALEYKKWPHPSEAVAIVEEKGDEQQTLQIYTDGAKMNKESAQEWRSSQDRNLLQNYNTN